MCTCRSDVPSTGSAVPPSNFLRNISLTQWKLTTAHFGTDILLFMGPFGGVRDKKWNAMLGCSNIPHRANHIRCSTLPHHLGEGHERRIVFMVRPSGQTCLNCTHVASDTFDDIHSYGREPLTWTTPNSAPMNLTIVPPEQFFGRRTHGECFREHDGRGVWNVSQLQFVV